MKTIAETDHMHCTRCAWEGQAADCGIVCGARECPVCGSDAMPYDEWLTDYAEDM